MSVTNCCRLTDGGDEVRRLYKQALRQVHPDKLRNVPDLPLAERLLAQQAFGVLVEQRRKEKRAGRTRAKRRGNS